MSITRVRRLRMSLEDLEKRIQAIEDLESIKKLHQTYINLMDNLQYEAVLDLFTEDATAEIRNSGVKKGRKEMSEIYIGVLAKNRGTQRYDGHMAIEPDITVDGDIARGTWLIYMLFSRPTIQWVQGRNESEYRKENGKWKISKMKFTRTLASDPALYP
jgi:ketosteroid isomerase-like protein